MNVHVLRHWTPQVARALSVIAMWHSPVNRIAYPRLKNESLEYLLLTLWPINDHHLLLGPLHASYLLNMFVGRT